MNARTFPRIKMGRAVTALLLLAVLSTAALVHLVWYRTASRNIETIVASLDAQSTAAVRNELSSNLALVSSSAEIVRSVFFQGAIRPDDEVKREFLFLSLLREQPAIAWIGFGFPDGRFFGAHALPDGEIEMVEIGHAPLGKPRPLRRDLYKPIPGDIFFENRLRAESVYVPEGSPWFRRGRTSAEPAWSLVNILPNGFEPAIVVSKKVEVFGHFEGVVMVAVSLHRLSAILGGLKMPEGSKAFVLTRDNAVLATSEPSDGMIAAHLKDFAASDALAAAVAMAASPEKPDGSRTLVASKALGPIFVSSGKLPFEDWRLVTAIPRATFARDIDANTERLIFIIGGIAVLAAVTAILFARILFARPLSRLAEQLHMIERFELDAVEHRPALLTELDHFSSALKRMSSGLAAFARFMPVEVVRPLVDGGLKPRPGGELRDITVLFADLPGFTELTEEFGAGVEPSLTRFLTLSIAAIHAEGGTVDKFIGDAVMAIWNAPGNVPDHALRACRAAAAIRDAMHAMAPIAPKHDEIRVRIGINTGVALVGNIGSTERLSYTAIGDVVNLASRLVGVAKDKGVEIALSDETLRKTRDLIQTRPLGCVGIRGRIAPVRVHTIDPADMAD
ncbi:MULTISPECIES: adenylate/guanylate cyclase domain-containing protein [Rhizobium]|uniref:adenylate/guanylate cyclase domain-containing protein n=1 Tax=Rhizobium TaxID=379 RepID=UPI001B33B91F|nr:MULTISPECIES: adenylate/guanylate cyclase domain-containing protein [Rhizobium]MBX4908968.1 adenylate/guanylate cyclase domain-containing protein [Rhizobium bangladeshense]MBX5216100.1 adenylate/guanylate cyclase domain-containing protein [Rhizobium sp. NLR9a]MBX5234480.1 adenylate/guanylate cyclase domain-containing protein [Rhizobium sp. NLR4a]MBX5246800.1 adenylate/guanylate cyclase domain-containing protein [Rhizobium sp. NLR3b]MBX5251481.1 adenylate/guanylate cyclase domain-containing 